MGQQRKKSGKKKSSKKETSAADASQKQADSVARVDSLDPDACASSEAGTDTEIQSDRPAATNGASEQLTSTNEESKPADDVPPSTSVVAETVALDAVSSVSTVAIKELAATPAADVAPSTIVAATEDIADSAAADISAVATAAEAVQAETQQVAEEKPVAEAPKPDAAANATKPSSSVSVEPAKASLTKDSAANPPAPSTPPLVSSTPQTASKFDGQVSAHVVDEESTDALPLMTVLQRVSLT